MHLPSVGTSTPEKRWRIPLQLALSKQPGIISIAPGPVNQVSSLSLSFCLNNHDILDSGSLANSNSCNTWILRRLVAHHTRCLAAGAWKIVSGPVAPNPVQGVDTGYEVYTTGQVCFYSVFVFSKLWSPFSSLNTVFPEFRLFFFSLYRVHHLLRVSTQG